jgi:hypothetical protein
LEASSAASCGCGDIQSNQGDLMSIRALAALAAAIVVAHPISVRAEATDGVNLVPSSLLAVEQNRRAIVEGVVDRWRESLQQAFGANAAQKEDELRAILMGLRSDLLLSASLAGSVEGLVAGMRDAGDTIRDGVVDKKAPAAEKALGSTTQDVVFTPLTPCRIADTRNPGAGGPLVADATNRTFVGFTATDFTAQGGQAAAGNCGVPNGATALVLNITAVQPQAAGFLRLWPSNLSMPFASMLNFAVGDFATSTGTIVPVNSTNNQFNVFSPATVDFVADVAGYFKAPSPLIVNGGVTNAMLGTGSVSLSKLDTASVDTRYVSKSFVGTQISGSLAPGASAAWFTFGYPTSTRFFWRVVPTTVGGKMQMVSQDVELAGNGTYTYHFSVRNTGSIATNYEIQRFGLN